MRSHAGQKRRRLQTTPGHEATAAPRPQCGCGERQAFPPHRRRAQQGSGRSTTQGQAQAHGRLDPQGRAGASGGCFPQRTVPRNLTLGLCGPVPGAGADTGPGEWGSPCPVQSLHSTTTVSTKPRTAWDGPLASGPPHGRRGWVSRRAAAPSSRGDTHGARAAWARDAVLH